MLSTDYGDHIRYADQCCFDMVRPGILAGQTLADIRILEASLKRFGLLSPLTVVEKKGRLLVVDGRKRLMAMRRLRFQDALPRSLTHVPYESVLDVKICGKMEPSLTASQTLYQSVEKAFRAGLSPALIALKFRVSSQSVRDLLTLSRLSDFVRQSFFDRMISFPQAAAYASLPDKNGQTRLLQQLGPFATPEEICSRVSCDHSNTNDIRAVAA